MYLVSVLLLLASADPAAVAPGGAQSQPKAEKKICKRIDSTESRMASKRICKTARQWKEEQPDDPDFDLSRDTRIRKG